MASIRKRTTTNGEKRYVVLFRDGDVQRAVTWLDAASAAKYKRNIEQLGVTAANQIREAERHSLVTTDITVAEMVARHLDGLSGIQQDTLDDYWRKQRTLADTRLGRTPLAGATRDDVAAWVRDLEKSGQSGKSIRNHHSPLSAALSRAVDEGLVGRNVAKGVKIPRTEREEMVIISPPEFAKLIHVVSEHYRPFIMLLYGTGLRFNEATALRVSDFRLDDRPATLTVARAWKRAGSTVDAPWVIGAPKTKAARRTLSIPSPVVEAVRPLLAGKRSDEYVFLNPRRQPIRENTFWALWDKWRGVLDTNPRIHDLRHSHASIMLANGMGLHDLKQRLGHSSITTTSDTYGHFLPEAQVQAERAAALAFVALPAAPKQPIDGAADGVRQVTDGRPESVD